RYVDGTFDTEYFTTIINTFTRGIHYKSKSMTIQFVDTAVLPDIDEYSNLDPCHIIETHSCMLVYSVTSRASFNMIEVIYKKLKDNRGVSIPCVIVGNKSDLEHQRKVTAEEARKLAEKLRCSFQEASVKTNTNTTSAFKLLFEQIKDI
ncbi:GTP-binding protein of the ras family, partial [Lasiosphaeria miniovina]